MTKYPVTCTKEYLSAVMFEWIDLLAKGKWAQAVNTFDLAADGIPVTVDTLETMLTVEGQSKVTPFADKKEVAQATSERRPYYLNVLIAKNRKSGPTEGEQYGLDKVAVGDEIGSLVCTKDLSHSRSASFAAEFRIVKASDNTLALQLFEAWTFEKTPCVLPITCSDDDIRQVVVTWSELLAQGKYVEAAAMVSRAKPYYLEDRVWDNTEGDTPTLMRSIPDAQITSLYELDDPETAIQESIKVQRDRDDGLGWVEYQNIPLGGDPSDLSAQFRLIAVGSSELTLEFDEMHVQ